MRKKSLQTGLTELESHVLSIIWRNQPTTAYQVRHAFTHSPTADLALSQGSTYPAIERLKKRGYVQGTRQKDARKTEHLVCTPAGEGAVAQWVMDVALQLPSDPLRSRMLALSILSESERREWVEAARTALLRNLADLEEFAQAHSTPVFDLAHDNARSGLLARIRWLDRVEAKLDTLR